MTAPKAPFSSSSSSPSSDVISIAILGKDNEPLYIREFIRIVHPNNNNDNDDDDDVNNDRKRHHHHHHQYYDDDELELLFDLPSMAIGNSTDTQTSGNDDSAAAAAAAHNDVSDGVNTTGTTTTTTTTTTKKPSFTTKCSVKQQFIMHAALDRLEQLAGPPPGYGWRNNNNNNKNNAGAGADGMFVGLLCPAEDQRVYGYVSTTKIKFILVTDDDGTSTTTTTNTNNNSNTTENNIKLLLMQIHELYIEDMLNPFKTIGSPITSKRFERRLEELIQEFNNTYDGMI